MSQENVEIVRHVYEPFNRGDWDAVYRDLAGDVEMTTPPRGLDAGIFRGREEGQAYWEDFFRPYETVTVEPVEFFESGDQLVVFVELRLRPRGSSAEAEVRIGHLWTIRDATVLSLRIFPEREKALEAAGISE
jgi:ketosteroid isomerase-like protein